MSVVSCPLILKNITKHFLGSTKYDKIQKAILGDGIEKNKLPFPNTPLLAKMIRINNCLLNTYFVPGTGRSPLCAFPLWAVIALEVAITIAISRCSSEKVAQGKDIFIRKRHRKLIQLEKQGSPQNESTRNLRSIYKDQILKMRRSFKVIGVKEPATDPELLQRIRTLLWRQEKEPAGVIHRLP